jgi:hypothetical protein
MRPLVWRAHAGAARVLSALGRDSEAEPKLQEARQTIDEIASLFEDPSLATSFRQTATNELSVGSSGALAPSQSSVIGPREEAP